MALLHFVIYHTLGQVTMKSTSSSYNYRGHFRHPPHHHSCMAVNCLRPTSDAAPACNAEHGWDPEIWRNGDVGWCPGMARQKWTIWWLNMNIFVVLLVPKIWAHVKMKWICWWFECKEIWWLSFVLIGVACRLDLCWQRCADVQCCEVGICLLWALQQQLGSTIWAADFMGRLIER